MSWSFYGLGKPAALKREVTRQCEGMSASCSRREMEAVLPALQTLLDNAPSNTVMNLAASGHGYEKDGVIEPQGLSLDLKAIGILVE